VDVRHHTAHRQGIYTPIPFPGIYTWLPLHKVVPYASFLSTLSLDPSTNPPLQPGWTAKRNMFTYRNFYFFAQKLSTSLVLQDSVLSSCTLEMQNNQGVFTTELVCF
jgi:hypothetical protein